MRRYEISQKLTNFDLVNIMYWSLQTIFKYKPKISPQCYLQQCQNNEESKQIIYHQINTVRIYLKLVYQAEQKYIEISSKHLQSLNGLVYLKSDLDSDDFIFNTNITSFNNIDNIQDEKILNNIKHTYQQSMQNRYNSNQINFQMLPEDIQQRIRKQFDNIDEVTQIKLKYNFTEDEQLQYDQQDINLEQFKLDVNQTEQNQENKLQQNQYVPIELTPQYQSAEGKWDANIYTEAMKKQEEQINQFYNYQIDRTPNDITSSLSKDRIIQEKSNSNIQQDDNNKKKVDEGITLQPVQIDQQTNQQQIDKQIQNQFTQQIQIPTQETIQQTKQQSIQQQIQQQIDTTDPVLEQSLQQMIKAQDQVMEEENKQYHIIDIKSPQQLPQKIQTIVADKKQVDQTTQSLSSSQDPQKIALKYLQNINQPAVIDKVDELPVQKQIYKQPNQVIPVATYVNDMPSATINKETYESAYNIDKNEQPKNYQVVEIQDEVQDQKQNIYDSITNINQIQVEQKPIQVEQQEQDSYQIQDALKINQQIEQKKQVDSLESSLPKQIEQQVSRELTAEDLSNPTEEQQEEKQESNSKENINQINKILSESSSILKELEQQKEQIQEYNEKTEITKIEQQDIKQKVQNISSSSSQSDQLNKLLLKGKTLIAEMELMNMNLSQQSLQKDSNNQQKESLESTV